MSKHSPDADVAFISALAELLNKNELTELSVKRDYGDDDSLEVRLVKQVTVVTMAAPAPTQHHAPLAQSLAATSAPAAIEDPAQHPGAVTSPMVGTIYLAESALATALECDGLLEMGPPSHWLSLMTHRVVGK